MSVRKKTRATYEGEFIPIIDVGSFLAGKPGSLISLSKEIAFSLEHIGFFYIVNHGVPKPLIARIFKAAKAFHNLPVDEKLALKSGPDLPGFYPMKLTTIVKTKNPDQPAANVVELFLAQRDRVSDKNGITDGNTISAGTSHAMNKWPNNEPIPGFREIVNAYHDTMQALGRRLLPLYAQALGMPPGYFYNLFRDPQSIVRIAKYPVPDIIENNQWGAAPHGDMGFLTMLPEAQLPGLEIKMPSGEWIPQPIVPDALLVNAGETLRELSNHRFSSTPHRVKASLNTDRYQISFFFNPDSDAMVGPLPSCVNSDYPPCSKPITFKKFARNYMKKSNQYSKTIHKS